MLQSQGVADFMRRQLSQARQHHLLHDLRDQRFIISVRRGQSFGDQKILPVTQRAKRNPALDDLAGARIADRRAIRPAARRAMHPLDHVVANIHRIGAGGHQLDAKRILVADGFECLVPPTCAFDER